MKLKLVAFAIVAVIGSASAQAADYVCQVYCLGPSGSTTATVSASSASEAANIVDGRSDKICQNAGHDRSTPQTMSASQCSRD